MPLTRQHGRTSAIAIVLLGAGVIAALWFLRPQPQLRPQVAAKPPLVEVMVAAPQPHQVMVLTQGTVTPARQIDLVAEVSGRVVDVSAQFVSGGAFGAGEALITLDDRDYRYALAVAESQVATAERELALEQGRVRQAKREWRDLGSASANALSLREPQLKAARAALVSARAERDRARLNLQRTAVAAPFTGRIENTRVNLGQYVPAGTPLATLYDTAAAEVRLPLSYSQLVMAGVSPGATLVNSKPLILYSDAAGTRHQWSAQLTRVDASIDSRTRFYHVIASVEQPLNADLHQQPLPVGLFVSAEIPGQTFTTVMPVPKKALLDEHLFVVTDANTLERRPVTVVDRQQQQFWVQADIAAGEAIVVSDPRVLREGMTVRTNAERTAAASPASSPSSQSSVTQGQP